MKKKILINAKYPEEKRVAIMEGDVLTDFYVEVSSKVHLKGNIYKAIVARVEPGLQAAFVDFGPKKHGFLQLREIMPTFYAKNVEGRRVRIQDVITKGQELIVQVEKDERDTKGASVTTYLSLPGRYIVMMPGQERVGISRKIEDREDRDRLREIFNALKLPKGMGFILRTAGGDKTEEDLENDLKYLTKLWSKIQRDVKKSPPPALVYMEQDFAVRTVRDYLTTDVGEVIVDDQDAYRNIRDFLKKTTPWRKINIRLYKETKPIFARYHADEQIAKIHERHVYLPSKGYLVIDKTEALTAIDVNSGRSRKEEHVEATALRTNLEAADEIARQLRLRDIGGLIVIDFIDMVSTKNRREVEKQLRTALSSDKAHWEISSISKFGIVEMTRERMRVAYLESIHRKCENCGGTGIIKTDEMVAISALREIHARATQEKVKAVTCRLPVESLNYLINAWREELAKTEKSSGVTISLIADLKLQPGQYKIDVEGPETEGQRPRAERHEPHRPKQERRDQERGGQERREAEKTRPGRPEPEQELQESAEEEITEDQGLKPEIMAPEVLSSAVPGQEAPAEESAASEEARRQEGRRRSRRWSRRPRRRRGGKPKPEGQAEVKEEGQSSTAE